MNLRRALRIAGRCFLGLGVLLLLFVAFQLWGTGILEARHQAALRQQFETELHIVHTRPTHSGSGDGTPADTTPSLPAAPGERPADGRPVAIVEIPKINLDVVVVAGTSTADLTLGPGLYPGSPLPGQKGNSAIAGHRTTFGAPFYSLNRVGTGDPIYVTTLQGRFRFVVSDTEVVDPYDVAVVASTSSPSLTLTTCDPPFSAAERLVVHARLIGKIAPTPPPAAASTQNGTTTVERLRVSRSVLVDGPPDGSTGWAGALLWGLGLLAIGTGVWLVARTRRRRWPAYALSVPLFAVPLFFFFEGVQGLLPQSF
jgi:sortase A